jgi:hypothetical protein
MARTVRHEDNSDRVARVQRIRHSNASGPHANRARPRGGRNGLKAAIRKAAI